ncbi:FecR family protein [Sphingobacterium deserti]|uniref:FecR protein n=1 Tax=Sphingobacterium deserti TaxID=1229276 RepID=A0A0B8T373_9SPHI|nr:FecR domain-containing protein [Sphingobacterium deserti]KGE15506.1 FecR protein [Sphingobacterium deserti]
MENRARIYYLFSQQQKSQLSESEFSEWKMLLEDPFSEPILEELMEDFWSNKDVNIAPLASEQVQFIYQRVILHKQYRGRSKVAYIKFILAAACVLIFGVISISTLTISKQYSIKGLEKLVVEQIDYSAFDQPVLCIDENTEIKLDDVPLGNIYEDDDYIVIKTKEGGIEYKSKSENSVSRVIKHKIIVPRKRIFQVGLSDDTRVHLNAESYISFTNAFGSDRVVLLAGEGYFDVRHREGIQNTPIPFSVETGKQTLTVLGTVFNIRSYPEEAETSTLLKGKVAIECLSKQTHRKEVLSPGQQLTFDGAEISIGEADIDLVVSWLNGDFLFDDISLDKVMRELSRWYDIDVDYKSLPKSKKFYGKIRRSSNIEDILLAIERTSNVKLTMKGRRVMGSS